MSRAAVAVALVLVLVMSVLVGFVAVGHAAPARSPTGLGRTAAAVVPSNAGPAAGPSYALYNGYDGGTTTYYLGEVGYNTLNFAVTDFLDHDVNVTITDPNASRDSVATPAFTYEAHLNTTTSSFDSYMAGVHYTFPTLPYGGVWVVNFSAPTAGYVTQNVTLQTYYVDASGSVSYPQSTLPGMPISVFWWAYLDANENSLYAHATQVWLEGHYTGNGTSQNLFPGGWVQLTTGSWGEWNGTVPLNASADTAIVLDVFVVTNVSGKIAENESRGVDIYVGALYIDSYGVTLYPAFCLGNYYTYIPVGTLIGACIEVTSDYEDSLTPFAGLPVTISYWNGVATVTPTGTVTTSTTTNAVGDVTVVFNGTSPPFATELQYPGYDSVNFTVKVPGADSPGGPWTVWENLSDWVLTPFSGASGVVQLSLDHTEYYPGSTATATWAISSSNSALTGPITANNWVVYDDRADNTVYATGVMTGTAQSGTFTFGITSAMVGRELDVEVFASNATLGFYANAYANVIAPNLLLSPSSDYYSAGSTESVTALLNGGSTPAGTTISWQAFGDWSNGDTFVLITSGMVTNGASFSIPIASSPAPQYVEVDAWASTGGQVIATAGTEMALSSGYMVVLGVSTVSSYSDGSYQPGQTVTLTYAVVSLGGAPLPQSFDFDLYAQGFAYDHTIENAAASGTLPFTIPSNALAGDLIVQLTVTGALNAGPCVPASHCAAQTGLLINPQPSVFSMELGAGSGLTVGWLVLLLVILVVLVVLLLVIRRGRTPKSPSWSESGTGMNPPSPAPSTPPASEWKGPETPPAGSDPQPPLPNPPA